MYVYVYTHMHIFVLVNVFCWRQLASPKVGKGGGGEGRWTKNILSFLLLTSVACFASVKNVSCTWTGTDKCGLLCLCEKRQLHMDWYWQVWLALSLITSVSYGVVLTSVSAGCNLSVSLIVLCETWPSTPDSHLPFPRWLIDCRA